MTGILALIFFISAGLLAWTYILYPALVIVAARVRPKPRVGNPFRGKVSMIVAAHNEEAVIKQKVENSLGLDYGGADWEVIVVSDGSRDGTDSVLEGLRHMSERLKIITYQPRQGKANALNVGSRHASGEVLIFTDANVFLEPDAPKKLLSQMSDPSVGAVCGRVLLCDTSKKEVSGEGIYMRFEGAVQEAESALWSMVGIDGALYALRRELFRPLDRGAIIDDFSLSMEALLAGKRIVYAGDAVAVEHIVASVENEFKRKSRIVAGGFQYLASLAGKGGRFGVMTWFIFFSHKILRWLSPFFMIAVFASSLTLMESGVYRLLVLLQAVFYALAFGGHIFPSFRKNMLFYIPYYFSVVNLAALAGFTRFFLGRQGVSWEKVARG